MKFIWVWFPLGAGTFLFPTAVFRSDLGPTRPPIQWVPGALSPRIKRPRCKGDHSPPSSAEVKNAWSYTSITPYVFMAWCLVRHRTRLHAWLNNSQLWNHKSHHPPIDPVESHFNPILPWSWSVSRPIVIGSGLATTPSPESHPVLAGVKWPGREAGLWPPSGVELYRFSRRGA
jgi:hypothetical protein